MKEKPYLSFREDKSFRILHLTDIQEGFFPRKDTFRLLEAVLKSADPDLVILTGDQLKGYEPLLRLSGRSGIEKTIKRLMEPLEQSGVPYAVTFGNHDVQCGLSNEEQAKIYRQLSGCICGDDGPGAGTFFLPVHNRSGEIIFMIYVLDSGNTGEKGSYHPPADKVLTWFENSLMSDNAGKAAMIFQHIPLPEYKKCSGVEIKEPICSPDVNTGEFEILQKRGEIAGVFCGHDHKNDFLGQVNGINLGYTPSCGFACYGPGVDRGGRLIVLREDSPMQYETRLLRYRDLIAPHTKNRLKEYWDTHIPTCWPMRKTENEKENA